MQARPEPIGDTLDRARAVLDPWLGVPRRLLKEGRVNLVYRFDSEDAPPLKLRLKVEINTREHSTELGVAPATWLPDRICGLMMNPQKQDTGNRRPAMPIADCRFPGSGFFREIALGVVEGMNGNAKLAIRKARGVRTYKASTSRSITNLAGFPIRNSPTDVVEEASFFTRALLHKAATRPGALCNALVDSQNSP